MATSQQLADIALAIRIRICVDGALEPVTLHETVLSRQFDISRTPIRQVLQMLSAERLVETRAGVGTVSTPLRPEEARGHADIAAGLLRLAAEQASGTELTPAQKADFAALLAMSEMRDVGEVEEFLWLAGRATQVIEHVIADPVLAQAVRAAQWRLIRWIVRRAIEAPTSRAALFESYRADLKRFAAIGLKESPVALLRGLAEATERRLDPVSP